MARSNGARIPMHPKIVLPAIEAAMSDVAEAIREHAALAARLKPGETIVSFNPHVATPGSAVLPAAAEAFRFWEIADEETFSTFMEGLAIQLDMLDLPHAAYGPLPRGYAIARYVLRFETHCRFSAWLAVENVGAEDMRLVRHYYAEAGLPEEALALERAEAAWYAAGGHDGSGYDAAAQAYRSVANPWADEDARWFHLLAVLRDPSLWVPG
jgi:hypothetical protein